MPELPEVETVRSYLDDVVKGRKIVSVDVLLPRLIKNRNADEFAASLTGCTFMKITRKGKYLFLHLNANSGILAHLRLTGRFLYEDDDGKDLPRFSRIVFHLDKGRLIYGDIRTLGCLWIVPDGAVTGIKGYDTLGPDGISPDFTPQYLWNYIHRRKTRIKAILLDQTCVAGVGNIYVDEALFLAGIRPSRRCDKVTKKETEALCNAIHAVLEEGLAYGGTTIINFVNASGKEGQNQENLNVYGREGKPCPNCGTPITYVKQGGRGTHYCRYCQK